MYCDISRALPKCPWARRRALFYVYLLVLCLQNGWIERSRSWQHPPPPHLSVVHGTRQMWSEWNCQHLFKRKKKKIASVGASELHLQMSHWPWSRLGEEKRKQIDRWFQLWFLQGTDGPVITGLEHVAALSSGCCFPSLERQRMECRLKPEHVCALKQQSPRTSYSVSVGQRTAEADI